MGDNGNPQPNQGPPRLALKVGDVAVALSLSPAKVHQLVQSGELPSLKIGRSRRVTVGAVEGFLADREREEQLEHVS